MLDNHKYRLYLLRTLRLNSIQLISFCILFFSCSGLLAAGIAFKEVTTEAGILHQGQTYGASWGDINGDGWPDIWVGNHNSKPSLYLNNKDGGFSDVIDDVWQGDPKADSHGAAWADYDNDGDQDLVELVGALEEPDGSFCVGCGRNNFYINNNGILVNKAKDLGLDIQGFARSPQWLDANKDGLLDLVVVNTRKPKKPRSTLFMQTKGGFVNGNETAAFKDERWSRRDQIRGWLNTILDFRFQAPSLIDMRTHLEFPQFAPLSNSENMNLILFSSPTRVFDITEIPFTDATALTALPDHRNVTNLVLQDFNGDGKTDLYLAIGPYITSDLIQVTATKLKGTLTGSGADKPKTVNFKSKGELNIELHPSWLRKKDIFIGAKRLQPDSKSFTLSPKDTTTHLPSELSAEENSGLQIGYDPTKGQWTLRNGLKGQFVDFIITSTEPVSDIETLGFKQFKEAGVDALYLRHENEFIRKELTEDAGSPSACHFASAGDFDNDMDIDLYLVCSGPIANIPNRLLENDGAGNFSLVPNAGGAAGSKLGRGDIAAIADYDRDGFLDLFVTNGWDPTSPFVLQGPHQLFRNQGNDNHWLEIDLQGTASNRDGIGATVTIKSGGVTQTRHQNGGISRITQNHQRLHFGLGGNTEVEQITIKWPSGKIQTLSRTAADQILQIREAE